MRDMCGAGVRWATGGGTKPEPHLAATMALRADVEAVVKAALLEFKYVLAH